MPLENVHVTLTKSQGINLIEFIEMYFIQAVRVDTDIENVDYIIDMMDALKKFRHAKKTFDYSETEDQKF